MNETPDIDTRESDKRSRYWLMPLAIVLGILGLTLSHSVFKLVERQQAARIQNAFHLDVNRQLAKLEQGLGKAAEQLSSVGAFYLSSDSVDPEEFRSYTAGYLRHDAGPSLLAWAPIEMLEDDLDESQNASMMTSMSLPLLHIEPGPQERLGFGDDLLGIPGISAAVEIAFQRGNVEHLIVDENIIMVKPTLDYVDWSGVAILVLPLEALGKWISIDDWEVSISILEERTGKALLQSKWLGDEEKKYSAAFSFGAEMWRVTAMPKPGNSAGFSAWATFGAGVLITVLLLILILALASNAERARKMVQVRTRALQQAEAEARGQAIKLADEMSHSSQIIASIPSMLISLDTNGHVTQWNPATQSLSGIESQNTVGRPLRECGWSGDLENLLAGLNRCLSEKSRVQLDNLIFSHPGGNDLTISMTIIPMQDSGHTPDGYLIIGADVTDKNMMEVQLREAQRLEAVGRLAAGIAHEVNTPAQFVSHNTSFLKEAFGDLVELVAAYERVLEELAESATDEQKQRIADAQKDADRDFLFEEVPHALEQSIDGVRRIADIVRAMKEFSHPGGGSGAEQVDFNRLINNAITVAANEWKYHAEIETDLDETLPPLSCYPRELNQVVLNLLINAAHSIADKVDGNGERGKISIETSHNDQYIQLRLTDTGLGIPELVRGKVFEPFFTTKEVGKGSGQGLALAYAAVVDKHGGQLSFETESGVGTTFIVNLPLRVQEVAGEAVA